MVEKNNLAMDDTKKKSEEDVQIDTRSQQVEFSSNSDFVEKKSSTGKGLAILSILITFTLCGGGYYFIQKQNYELQQQINILKNVQTSLPDAVSEIDLNQDHKQLEQLKLDNQANTTKINELEMSISQKDRALSALQEQVNKLGSFRAEQPTDWLLSEADFLLSNALRKLILDNDIETSIALLKITDEILVKINDPKVIPVRAALNTDLKQLLSVNNVDQNAIMQRLSQLANSVDELVVLNVNFGEQEQSDEPTQSIADWKSNLEKSATSFLNHFIRITPRTTDAKPLLAPNQDIYLRENIRLRLQIAILAVPRQQDELYKQSLESVSSWVRSYFDTSVPTAVNFLKEVDELSDKSIYIDTPEQLSSLKVLDELLNRQTLEVKKIEISADKELTEENKPADSEKTNQDGLSVQPAVTEPSPILPTQPNQQ